MAHRHLFRLTGHVVLGLPDQEGWVPQLIIRACHTCPEAELFHAIERDNSGEHRIHSWEIWTPLGCMKDGEWEGWDDEAREGVA
jgi:hypothetical protein